MAAQAKSLSDQPAAPASPAKQAATDPKDFALDGLYLSGIVKGRQRRVFPKKGGGQRYMICLQILTGQGMFRPERWCDIPDPGDVPLVGEHVCLRIGLVTFRSATGTGVRLTWGPDTAGDEF